MSNAKIQIRFSGSKTGEIIAHRWSGRTKHDTIPWPGQGRWLRVKLDKARAMIATGEAVQYLTGRNELFAHHDGF